MENEQMQPNNTDPAVSQDQLALSTDDIASAMGFMTTMGQQQMMAQQAEEMPEEPEETEEEPEEDIKGEFEAFKKEVKSMIKEEIGSLKEMIVDSIEEPEENEED